jgi:hypothetical protein
MVIQDDSHSLSKQIQNLQQSASSSVTDLQNNIYKLNNNIENLTKEHAIALRETENKHTHSIYNERESFKRERESWQKELEHEKRSVYEKFHDQVNNQ